MLMLTLVGCLKPAPVPRVDVATPVAVAAVLEYLDTDAVEPWPDALEAAIAEVLSARNLPPIAVDDTLIESWSALRGSRQRLEAMPADGAELLLLLETHAEFYSQLSGQFRWTVAVRASIAPSDDRGAATVAEFEVPVFLFQYNEREREALEAAAPNIEREVGALVERFLGI